MRNWHNFSRFDRRDVKCRAYVEAPFSWYVISCGPCVLKESKTIQTYVMYAEMYARVNALITPAISLSHYLIFISTVKPFGDLNIILKPLQVGFYTLQNIKTNKFVAVCNGNRPASCRL